MDSASTYQSCIKIPSTNSRQNGTGEPFPRKVVPKKALMLNDQLISLANRVFGEGKWSHSITSQTLDFVETFMGKYTCGCVTFVKIQLQDGTFHEDMAYCHSEGNTKGLSIHGARIGSLAEAFRKTLSCFGEQVKTEIEKLSIKLSTSHASSDRQENSSCRLSDVQDKMPEPCARSTPLVTRKNDEEKEKIDAPLKIKSLASPAVNKAQSAPLRRLNDATNRVQSNGTNHPKDPKEQDDDQKEQHLKKALSDEEIMRLERKRKQLEKQAEYKRLMKEKEQQKSNENRNCNPKY